MVYLRGQVSDPFAITIGVLPGNVQAPFLFIIENMSQNDQLETLAT